jgi:hypothetical protein
MNKTVELKQQEELLDTMDNKNYSELEFESIENTPFTIVKDKDIYYGLIGNHRITQSYSDKEELKTEVTRISWDRIVQVVWAIAEKYKDINLEKE